MTAPSPTAAGLPVPLSREFAALLAELGIGRFDPAGAGGDVFVLDLPDSPDAALRTAVYQGVESDAALGYDEPNVQIWVRGPRGDPLAAEQRAQRVYDALHGLRRRDLPGGTPMLSCIGNQAGPVSVGPDGHGRHEFTVNFRVEIRRRTVNRK